MDVKYIKAKQFLTQEFEESNQKKKIFKSAKKIFLQILEKIFALKLYKPLEYLYFLLFPLFDNSFFEKDQILDFQNFNNVVYLQSDNFDHFFKRAFSFYDKFLAKSNFNLEYITYIFGFT